MSARPITLLAIALPALWLMAATPLAAEKPVGNDPEKLTKIIAAVPRDWPPQYRIDADGKPTGFAIDVIEAISARSGLSITYAAFDTFPDVHKAIAEGRADIVPNLGNIPERADIYAFTAPVETFVISIFVRRNGNGIKSFEDLRKHRVAVVRSNAAVGVVRAREDIDSVVLPGPMTALFELLSGHVDAVVYPQPVLAKLAREAGVEDRIKVVGEPVLEIKRAIGVRKDKPALLAKLDRAVKDFIGTPEYRNIYEKWYGRPGPFWTHGRVAAVVIGLVVAFFLLFASWRYRLLVRMNRRIAASEQQYRDLIEGAVPGVMIHAGQKPLFVNQSYAAIFGYDGLDELLRQRSVYEHVAPRDRERMKAFAEQRICGEEPPSVYEFEGIKKDGTRIWLENRGRVVTWQGRPAIQRTVVDITEKRQAEAALMARTRQQAVIAELGQRALKSPDLDGLLNTAARLLSGLLQVEFCAVLELTPKRDVLRLRAGVGWKPGTVGVATVNAGKGSQAGTTLSSGNPVVVNDWATETGFAQPPLLRDHGIVSGVSVIIGDVGWPSGVLCAHASWRRAFTEDDVLMLKTVAIVLASAISRNRIEEALRASEERLRGAIGSMQEGFALYDADDHLVMMNDVFRQLAPGADELLDRRARFDEVIRAFVENGLIADAVGREEEFIRERLEKHRDPKGPIVRHHSDDKWYIIKETRTPEGGTAATFSDITELKRAEEARHKSEDRLRGAIETMQEGFSLYDADDRLVMVNEEYRVFAPEADELLANGTRFEDIVRAHVESGLIVDAAGREEAFIRDRLEQHRNPKGPIVRRHSNGKWYVIKETRTPEGGVAATFSDITGLKQAEQALRESERRFRDFAEVASDWFWEMDKNLRFTNFGARRQALLHLSVEDSLGKTRWETAGADPDADPKWRDHRGDLLARRPFRDFEYDRIDGDGLVVTVSVSGKPVFDEAGNFCGYRGTARNVTRERATERALREGEQRFRSVIDHSPGGIVIKDLDGTILIANRTFCKWYKTESGDLVGKKTHEFLSEDAAESIAAQERRVLDTKDIVEGERRLTYPDGVTRDVFSQKFPIFGADGNCFAIGTVLNDITGRRREEQKFRLLVQAAPDAMVIVDGKGRIELINRQAETLFGYKADELKGKNVECLLPPDSRKKHIRHRKDYFVAPRARSMGSGLELRGLAKDGRVIPIEVSLGPIPTEDGLLVAAAVKDITGRKAAQEKLSQLQAELAHVSRLSTMGEMAAGLAHELNQPLTAITNYAKGTLRRIQSGQANAANLLPVMQLVADQALRAGDIIRKIRGFMNRSEPRKVPIDLNATINEAITLMAGEINPVGVEVVVDVPESLPPVMADSLQIQQVLLNLMRNAVTAMNGEGGGRRRLQIGAAAPGGSATEVEVYVKDDGPGVPADIKERLFEPFFTTKTDGLGMGLSISRTIVTNHDGRIWVSSDDGTGTSVHFTLPIGEAVQHARA